MSVKKGIFNQIKRHPVLGPASARMKSFCQEIQGYRSEQDRLRLLNHLPSNAKCVEIGVWQGSFSRMILKVCEPERLCLVDPWQFFPEVPGRMFSGLVARNQADMDAIYAGVQRRFRSCSEVEFFRQTSESFLSETTEQFDWIYIDGDHGEAAVHQDLALAWNRVVPGGFIAGDDYFWRDSSGKLAVKVAVDRFGEDRDREITLFGDQFLIQLPD